MRTARMKATSLTILIIIVLVILSTGYNIGFAQGIKPQEVSVAYAELSLANLGTAVALDWAPDGRTFAVSTGNDLRIFTTDLNEIGHWQGHNDLITSVDWKPDGKYIATASLDGTVRIWDAVVSNPTYGETLYTLVHAGKVFNARWSPVLDDNRLASHELTNLERTSESARTLTVINIWNVDTQSISKTLLTVPTERNITNVTWSPDGQYLVYSSLQLSKGQVISVWNTRSGQLIDDFLTTVINVRINDIAWQPNGDNIAYVDDLNSVVIINFAIQGGINYINDFRASPQGEALSVSWNNDGTELAIGGTDKHIYTWNPTTNEALVFSSSQAGDVVQVNRSPDGKRIASLSSDDMVRIWYLSGTTSIPTPTCTKST